MSRIERPAADEAAPRRQDDEIAAFWRAADDERPDQMRAELERILELRPEDDARALFERASLHDFLGEEAEAVPLYRAALDAGLAAPWRTQATIQLASSLRNVGDPSGAIAVLQHLGDDDELLDAARAFLTLALFDDGKPAAAVRTALQALAPHLPAYSRAVSSYAAELTSRPRVRGIVVGVLVADGHILAEEYRGRDDDDRFLRLPGGGIEFGETARDALDREFAEELGASIDEASLIGVTENIFDGHGKRGHEIVHAFRIRSATLEALPRTERLAVLDSDTTVGWYPVDAVRRGALPLYPPGILGA